MNFINFGFFNGKNFTPREIKAQKLEANRNDAKQKINEIISKMDEPKLQFLKYSAKIPNHSIN